MYAINADRNLHINIDYVEYGKPKYMGSSRIMAAAYGFVDVRSTFGLKRSPNVRTKFPHSVGRRRVRTCRDPWPIGASSDGRTSRPRLDGVVTRISVRKRTNAAGGDDARRQKTDSPNLISQDATWPPGRQTYRLSNLSGLTARRRKILRSSPKNKSSDFSEGQ